MRFTPMPACASVNEHLRSNDPLRQVYAKRYEDVELGDVTAAAWSRKRDEWWWRLPGGKRHGPYFSSKDAAYAAKEWYEKQKRIAPKNKKKRRHDTGRSDGLARHNCRLELALFGADSDDSGEPTCRRNGFATRDKERRAMLRPLA